MSHEAYLLSILLNIKSINVDKEMWEHAVVLLSNEC